MSADFEKDIEGFVVSNFLFGNQSQAPARDQSFLDSGVIDSTGVLELVSFVEQNYGVTINDDELVPANFDSVKNLAAFVSRKKLAA